MRADPEYFDARVAGWWVWGICQWIGGGWCAESNWQDRGERTGRQKKRPSLGKGGRGIGRTTADWSVPPNLGGSRGAAGNGIHASGLPKKMPFLSAGSGDGVGVHSRGVTAPRGRFTADEARRPELKVNHGVHGLSPVEAWMDALAHRLRRVRVCCGDWTRVLGPSATTHIGVTGVFLDPPYLADFRDPSLYGTESADVAHRVREWALEHGDDPKMRIALCGYEGEHQMPKNWQCVAWKASGGYAAAAGNHENSAKERIWFSPHCARARAQGSLFEVAS